jgi:tetratricopeptide (TPR) repeat protein
LEINPVFTPKSISVLRSVLSLIVLILLMSIVFLSLTAQTDSPGWWDHGCDQDASLILAEVMGEATHALGCEVFLECLSDAPYGEAIYCEVPLYEAFLHACTVDAALCKAKAGLYTTAITIFTVPAAITTSLDYNNAIPDILFYFNNGGNEGYQRAIEIIEQNLDGVEQLAIMPIDISRQPNLFVMSGVLYQYLGMNAEAIDAYTKGQSLFGETPLLYYLRAKLYAEMGELDLAAIDAFRFELITADFPQARGDATLSADYPLDMSKLTEWRVYPVGSESFGPGGRYIYDRTLLDPTSVQVGFLNDGETLLRLDFEGDETIVITLNRTSENVFAGDVRGGYMIVTLEGDLARVDRYRNEFESSGWVTMSMAPAYIHDLRIDRYPRCEGGARWQLNIGGEGWISRDSAPPPVSVSISRR